MLLIAGGDRDPNLAALAAAGAHVGHDTRALLIGATARPWLAWDLDRDTLLVDGDAIAPAAAFVRHDVFTHLADPRPATGHRALAWSTTLHGWLLAHPDVRCFNRGATATASNKPHVLTLARAVGLAIPRTVITNHAPTARALGDAIAKPVGGGALTVPLAGATATSAEILPAPAIVQERLHAPELRVYVVGDATFAFEVRSAHLDYRADADATVHYRGAAPSPIAAPLVALARRCGLDFAAADLKSRADGTLVFLELNTAPMFAAFDDACDGALCRTMVAWLTGGTAHQPPR